jgi:5-methylcytosine-specific restriction endonuclease McrA
MKKLCSRCGAIDVVSPCRACRQAYERARSRRRNAQRGGPARTSLPLAAKRRDRFQCKRCGVAGPPRQPSGPTLIAHHLVPIRWGGRNELSNLITLCPNCHQLVETRNRELDKQRRKAMPKPWRPADAEERERLRF